MERITAAIARAKKLRGATSQDKQRVTRRRSAARSGSEAVNISYSQTAVIPLDRRHLNANKVFAFDESDPRSGRFDMLRTQVLQVMDKEGLRTLGITSPTSGCGKTVISINLAAAIARQFNRTALIVDFDLKKPTVAQYLGLPHRPGLTEYLDGSVELHEALISPGIDRLVVLPSFGRLRDSAERMTSVPVQSFVSEVRDRYSDRVVIFDLPPILEADDVIAFLPLLDCAIVVAAAGVTSIQDLEETMPALEETTGLGVVFNMSDEKDSSYYRKT